MGGIGEVLKAEKNFKTLLQIVLSQSVAKPLANRILIAKNLELNIS